MTSLTKCVCRCIVGGEISSLLSRLSSKFASTNQKYCPDLDSYENKNPSPVGAEVALTTGCTWGVHVQVDRVQNSGFVQSHK